MSNNTFLLYSNNSVDEALKKLDSSYDGLSSKEVAHRQKIYGLNKLGEQKTSALVVLWRQLKSPFFFIFLGIAIVSLLAGEHYNGYVIFLCLLVNVSLGFFQEYRAERSLYLLKKYLIHVERVIRDGKEIEISHDDLVPGDIVMLTPGTVIPADVRFVQTENVLVDESILTGESAPVKKISTILSKKNLTVYEASNIGFAGTTVVTGKAQALIIATGKDTAMGEIASLTVATMRESSFAKDVGKLGKFIIKLILITLVVVFIGNVWIKQGKIDVISLFIFSTALAITVIPEALPVVVTFCLSQGVSRLAKKKVIVKRLSAIESLGSVEILCTDKTGTLTENVLTIANVESENPEKTVFYATLGAESSWDFLPQQTKGFDHVLWNYLTEEQQKKIVSYTRVTELPFDPLRKKNSVVVKKNHSYELVVRGMPEEVISLCTISNHHMVERYLNQEGQKGNRVLAIAHRTIPGNSSILDEEKNLTFLGFISFVDPLKPTAIEAVQKAKKLGIIIKVLSGDSKEVCGTVAYNIGLIEDSNEVITGFEFSKKSMHEKRKLVEQYSVFARVLPEQKYEIIQLLQHNHEVGYMGDGINDAPALKIADVSLAVQDAVDIARETADIILLKKSLLVIVNGIEEGRIILINTFKYLRTTISTTFGNFYSVALISLIIDYLPMLPIHLLLANILTDLPMISISLDTVSTREVKHRTVMNVRDIIIIATILGTVCTVFDSIYFGFFKKNIPNMVQTGWFTFSVLCGLAFIFSIRTKGLFFKAPRPSYVMIMLSLGMALLAVILPYIEWAQRIFTFTPMPLAHLYFIFFLVVCYFVTSETIKCLYYKYRNNEAQNSR